MVGVRLRRVLTVGAVLLLAACGSGGGKAKSDGALAHLTVFDQQVNIATGASTEAQGGKTGKPLNVGDVVSTDAGGFGEIDYVEGSLVRLDSSTHYVVTKLVRKDAVQQTEARLDVGRSWHQVKKLSGSESAYEVDTPNAVAAVAGTVFMVDCRTPTCVFTVIEGVVTVKVKSTGASVSVPAGQSLAVPPAGAAATGPLTPSPADLAQDTFALRNHNIDQGKGPSPVAAPATSDDQFAGNYDATYTLRSATGSNFEHSKPEKVRKVTWKVTSVCPGSICKITIASSSGVTYPGSFDGRALSTRRTETTVGPCFDDQTGQEVPGASATILQIISNSLRVTERASPDPFSAGPPTRLEGTSTNVFQVQSTKGECIGKTGRAEFTLLAVRRP
jgi:mannose-6-phosphate isomerase-like protein (cupin superfamily)